MRGVKSFAMVLCVGLCSVYIPPINSCGYYKATSKEGKEGGIELIQPPANSKPGDRVYFEGSDYESTL
jgi:aminoacyl tRNA synthase complex-interacting multifunctional protein 1